MFRVEEFVPAPSERITRRRVRPYDQGGFLRPGLTQVVNTSGKPEVLCEPPPFRDGCVDPCPECAVGKCGNCDGTALDQERDEIVQCPCRSAGHS